MTTYDRGEAVFSKMGYYQWVDGCRDVKTTDILSTIVMTMYYSVVA